MTGNGYKEIINVISLKILEGCQQISKISGAIMLTLKKAPFYKYSTCLDSFQTVLKQVIVMLSRIVTDFLLMWINTDFLLTWICFTLCGRRGEFLKPV